MLIDKLNNYNLILASKSPRRQELLKGLGLTFEIKTKEIEEIFPPALFKEEIPVYLANLKAKAFQEELQEAGQEAPGRFGGIAGQGLAAPHEAASGDKIEGGRRGGAEGQGAESVCQVW